MDDLTPLQIEVLRFCTKGLFLKKHGIALMDMLMNCSDPEKWQGYVSHYMEHKRNRELEDADLTALPFLRKRFAQDNYNPSVIKAPTPEQMATFKWIMDNMQHVVSMVIDRTPAIDPSSIGDVRQIFSNPELDYTTPSMQIYTFGWLVSIAGQPGGMDKLTAIQGDYAQRVAQLAEQFTGDIRRFEAHSGEESRLPLNGGDKGRIMPFSR